MLHNWFMTTMLVSGESPMFRGSLFPHTREQVVHDWREEDWQGNGDTDIQVVYKIEAVFNYDFWLPLIAVFI